MWGLKIQEAERRRCGDTPNQYTAGSLPAARDAASQHTPAPTCTKRMPRPMLPLSSFKMKVARRLPPRVLLLLPPLLLPLPPLLLLPASSAWKASHCSGSRKVRGVKSN